MAAAPAGPDLRLAAVETAAATGIENLFAPALQVAADLLLVAHHRVVEPRGEMPLARHRRQVFDRPALSQPFRQATIEERRIVEIGRASWRARECQYV